jgi:two-component system response regulator AtoC
MAHLLQHHWPGNVRELENAIERAMVLSDSETLEAESFSFTSSRKTTSIPLDQIFEGYSIKNAQKILEEDMITRALIATKGNRTQAAKLLEISHPSLLTKMKMYNIDL